MTVCSTYHRDPYQLAVVWDQVPDNDVEAQVTVYVRGVWDLQHHRLTLDRLHTGSGHLDLGPYAWMGGGGGEKNTVNALQRFFMIFFTVNSSESICTEKNKKETYFNCFTIRITFTNETATTWKLIMSCRNVPTTWSHVKYDSTHF